MDPLTQFLDSIFGNDSARGRFNPLFGGAQASPPAGQQPQSSPAAPGGAGRASSRPAAKARPAPRTSVPNGEKRGSVPTPPRRPALPPGFQVSLPPMDVGGAAPKQPGADASAFVRSQLAQPEPAPAPAAAPDATAGVGQDQLDWLMRAAAPAFAQGWGAAAPLVTVGHDVGNVGVAAGMTPGRVPSRGVAVPPGAGPAPATVAARGPIDGQWSEVFALDAPRPGLPGRVGLPGSATPQVSPPPPARLPAPKSYWQEGAVGREPSLNDFPMLTRVKNPRSELPPDIAPPPYNVNFRDWMLNPSLRGEEGGVSPFLTRPRPGLLGR